MQNLEMVCPILRELEGLARKPVLENGAIIQRNNQSLTSQFGQMDSIRKFAILSCTYSVVYSFFLT